ncbi:dTDP-4-dehydrorhamnose reductase [Rehaibacterium terrae]|jgi:dTDP-4-dehydrorhamnose reductase|uniref:dTDP-4-dehydrorhamnose reductase n=1 Tax=Rehaibacterium terrae TaxID=1341696 RepID=A0A7W8DEV3_9GAMM|nr:dTDP-4-dehydrorhamnose reductase [Rehaibacterium terrae]MBB5015962.1 dTDP-4-dehydrorhamnose reductase [Rehaibacterium terrae]
MKCLLIGADGQLGFELTRALTPFGDLVRTTLTGRAPGGLACEALDLSDAAAVAALAARHRPDLIVNAAAYTAVDRAEDEPALAQAINADAVAVLARYCADHGARLLHYSTDYVFDGAATRPYREDDAVAPLGVYGRSKRDGEDAVRASGCAHMIFRTAWVYAARGHNFMRTMLRLAAERDELRVVADQVGSPTPARWLAQVTALALAQGKDIDGTWHVVADGETSWYGFAAAIVEDAVAAGLLQRAPRVTPIATADFPTRARRPAYSRLDTGKLARDFGLRLPDWREGVRQVLGELVP